MAETIRVARYDVRGDVPDGLVEEIFRGHRLRNAMVAVERDHAERVAAVWASHPEVAAAQQAAEAARERVRDLAGQIEAAKVAGRSRSVPAHTATEMKQARAEARAAKQVREGLITRDWYGREGAGQHGALPRPHRDV